MSKETGTMKSDKCNISRRDFMKMSAVTIGSAPLTHIMAKERNAPLRSQPNIVFLLADDLGMETINCYGGTSYKTRNIDKLAESGVRFTHCFASPLCSPTRAQLLTGRYGFRTGIDQLVGKELKLDPTKEVTLPKILKEAGYDTAVTGKWHLCPNKETNQHIEECDFAEHFCYKGGAIPYGTPDNYLPDKHLEFALDYLNRRQNSTKPFYLQYSFGLPHSPYLPTPLNPNDPEGKDNFPYMVEYLDILVGKVMAKIKELNMDDNTIIIFAGDNGTERQITSTFQGKPIKGSKGSLEDTGSWVPLMISGPGISKGLTCRDLVDFCDFFPAFADLCDANMPQGVVIDGRSFAPQLSGQIGNPHEWVYVQIKDTWFIRTKEYKLNDSGILFDITNSPFKEKQTQNDAVKKYLSDEVERIKNIVTSTVSLNQKLDNSKRCYTRTLLSGESIIHMPQAHINEKVSLTIFNLQGSVIRSLKVVGNRAVWNGTNWYGESVSRGVYFFKATGKNWSATGRIHR